jgi:L-methionine (R)-S-oxide reductase
MWTIESKYQEPDFYQQLEKELISLISGEKNFIANLANLSSWIYHSLPDLNWCGFYLWNEEDQELVLGPFQGKPACIRIKSGKGVCGTAFSEKRTIKVDDVFTFSGHIACDSNTQSELVIPLIQGEKVLGVLDLDSPKLSRFEKRDAEGLTQIMQRLLPSLQP